MPAWLESIAVQRLERLKKAGLAVFGTEECAGALLQWIKDADVGQARSDVGVSRDNLAAADSA